MLFQDWERNIALRLSWAIALSVFNSASHVVREGSRRGSISISNCPIIHYLILKTFAGQQNELCRALNCKDYNLRSTTVKGIMKFFAVSCSITKFVTYLALWKTYSFTAHRMLVKMVKNPSVQQRDVIKEYSGPDSAMNSSHFALWCKQQCPQASNWYWETCLAYSQSRVKIVQKWIKAAFCPHIHTVPWPLQLQPKTWPLSKT